MGNQLFESPSTLPDLLADMNNSLLPIEICEHIIDSCRNPWHYYIPRRDSYAIWLRTALVCSAWLPTSRLNLLYEVVLWDASNVDLLLRTLQERPHFADMVNRLTAASERRRYVPFAQRPLPQLLKKCVALDLSEINWGHYPPRYADTGLNRWSGIVELRIWLETSILRTTIRFIWSLHQLRTLRLGWIGDLTSSRFLAKWWPGPQTGKCQSLRSLQFEVRQRLFHSVARLL